MKQKKEKGLASVKVNEDIWFYPLPKNFEFVVWQKIGNQKQAVIFRVLHSKLKKYL